MTRVEEALKELAPDALWKIEYDDSVVPPTFQIVEWSAEEPQPSAAAIQAKLDEIAARTITNWNTLESSLRSSTVYPAVRQRAKSADPIAMSDLSLLITTTRTRAQLLPLLTEVATATAMTAAEKAELNGILSQAGFSEQLS